MGKDRLIPNLGEEMAIISSYKNKNKNKGLAQIAVNTVQSIDHFHCSHHSKICG